jgi:RNase adapter protein RapZ
VDLRDLLRDPQVQPWFRELTGLDPRVNRHVLATRGAWDVTWSLLPAVAAVVRVNEPSRTVTRVAVGCAGGRHRSVVVAGELAALLLPELGIRARVYHRDVMLPVIQREAGREEG